MEVDAQRRATDSYARLRQVLNQLTVLVAIDLALKGPVSSFWSSPVSDGMPARLTD